MDPLSNRNRKNILSLNHGTWAVPPVVTGMATAQVHRHLPRDAAAGGQQLQMLPNHQQSQHQQQQQLAQPQHPAMAVFGQPQDSHRRGSQHHQHQHLDGLPKAFVAAMRTLFDIMDDRKTGLVRLADIEDRWLDDGSKGMPSGVIDSLRKVTPPNGLLSFERFCGGLKMCLVRNQPLPGVPTAVPSPSLSPPHSAVSSPADGKPSMAATLGKLSLSSRPPSAPLLDLDGAGGAGHGHGLGLPKVSLGPPWSSGNTSGVATGLNTATVRPNNAMPAQKTLSMPQLLSPDDDLEPPPIILPGAYGPPKPPRVSLNLERAQQKQQQQQQQQQPHHQHHNHVTPGSGIDKAEIRNALQNWQMSLLMGEANEKQGGGPVEKGHGLRSLTATGRGSADGQTDLSTSSPSLQSINQLDGSLARSGVLPGAMYPKKTAAGGSAGGGGGRRREPRRHTLQNGVDYNMLKRLKQIEQEKDILVQGLTAIEQTRDWYLKQLATVQEKIRYLGRPGSHMETWTETQQERLDLQRARVLEVNRHLMMLAESWERGGFPMHMNLALRPLPGAHGSPYQLHHHPSHQRRTQAQASPAAVPPAVPPPPSAASYQPLPSATQQQQHHHHHHHAHQPGAEVVNHLKQQNHQLVEEVNQKNEKLSLLEREKAALIRELLQLQRANRAASMISNTEEEMVF
ncbi:uncharacterized protein LOC128269667 [Anopheles cruzii]|uniref:uncharacterized protein LOC128269667 n=1 Tax=Anopheles cruzii TaxID=68878 RepID=UPI0022EC65FD|nr:uncharacterized protein LOC128269667 [Anopheles cruzii]